MIIFICAHTNRGAFVGELQGVYLEDVLVYLNVSEYSSIIFIEGKR